jgi:Ran GTPase-activating protein (RanGAP) involved in mRNA processing and transport
VVISCENSSNGLHLIRLKEIAPPFTLLEPVMITLSGELNTQSMKKPVSQKKRESGDYNSAYWNCKLEQLISENNFSSSMNFSQEQLIDQDIPIIIEQALIHKQCTILDLTGNEITFEGADLLAHALNNNTTLIELILYNNRLSDKGIRFLALELSINNSTLKKLNLGFNDITDDGAQHLAQMLKTNRTLIHLCLQQNHIGDRGVQLLAGVLARQNWTLELLNLFSNKFLSDGSIPVLSNMLQLNQSLQKLDIRDCNVTDIGEAKLQEIIKTKQDFELII